MIRMLICSCAVAILASGCCGPQCGPCGSPCYDCDGTNQINPYVGPFDTLRQLRRRMVCGSGCGGAYYGEWRSTPPDCEDPCCGGQWVGGAVPARPFCWQPGMYRDLIPRLYGGRFCDDCGASCSECECGGEVVYDEGYIDQSPSSSCNCAACNSGNRNVGTRLATQKMLVREVTPTRPSTTKPRGH